MAVAICLGTNLTKDMKTILKKNIKYYWKTDDSNKEKNIPCTTQYFKLFFWTDLDIYWSSDKILNIFYCTSWQNDAKIKCKKSQDNSVFFKVSYKALKITVV